MSINIAFNKKLKHYFNQVRKLIESSLSKAVSDSGMVERDEQDRENAGRKEWEKQVHSLPKNIKKPFRRFPGTKILKILTSSHRSSGIFFLKASLENPHFGVLCHETFLRLKPIKQEKVTCLQHYCLPQNEPQLALYCQKRNIAAFRIPKVDMSMTSINLASEASIFPPLTLKKPHR